MYRVWQALLAATLLALFGCSGGTPGSLKGCYASKTNGEPNIKIEDQDGNFTMKLLRRGQWSDDYKLHEGTEAELEELFGNSARHVETSLIADEGSLALFKVDPGQMNKESKYQAVLFILAGDVYKVSCD